VSLKHNSKFASFTIIAKGDFPAELHIPIPFSLVSNDTTNDQLVVMPAYWFMYNMYALERNAQKYVDRDKRTTKAQLIEYDYLAPDTINEIFTALHTLQALSPNEKGIAETSGWENLSRKISVIKVPQSITIFKELVQYYGVMQLLKHIQQNKFSSFDELKKSISAKVQRSEWLNIGGQLIQTAVVEKLQYNIISNKIKSWDEVHDFYISEGDRYHNDKLNHAYTSLLEILNITPRQFTATLFKQLLQEAITTREWMCKGIYDSRAKDYRNPFRKMVYTNNEEMNKVMGRIEDNVFIQQQTGQLDELKKQIKAIIRKLKL